MIRTWFTLVALIASGLASSPPARAEDRPLRQIIDTEIKAAWEREKVAPAPRADDAVFLRRVYLDLAGTIPTYDETKQFLQDSDPNKRARLIDKLLDDPRYAIHQADEWDMVLFGRNPPNPDATRQRDLFDKWLVEKFAKNEPYDRWVKELLVAEGDTQAQGPPLFYVQYRGQAEETAVAVTRIFLGTQLQCARCHDHPFEKWKQRDFYGMAAFFSRVVVLDGGGGDGKRRYILGEKSTGELLFTGPASEQKPGQKGEPIAAKMLGGDVLTEPPLPKDFKEVDVKTAKSLPKPVFSRKEKIADWITASDNPYFARAVVNRLWGQFLGRGLAHPVDNLSEKNPATHDALLQAMSEQMVAHKFDLKWFIREVVNSETYQLASTGEAVEGRWFERGRIRPLSAEEMLASLRVATGFDAVAGAKLPSGLEEQFLRQFGSPTDGRGDFQASLTERLFMTNNGNIRQLIQRKKGNLADTVLSSKAPWEERVDLLFLTVLNRPPRPEERQRVLNYVTSDPKSDPLVEEAIWVLLNSAEFRFNH